MEGRKQTSNVRDILRFADQSANSNGGFMGTKVMKYLDNKIGPVARPMRRSMAVLQSQGLKFRCRHLDREHCARLYETFEARDIA